MSQLVFPVNWSQIWVRSASDWMKQIFNQSEEKYPNLGSDTSSGCGISTLITQTSFDMEIIVVRWHNKITQLFTQAATGISAVKSQISHNQSFEM